MRSFSVFLICALVTCTLVALPVAAYSPAAVTLFNQGNASIASGNYTDAVTAFDRAIALEPGYYEAWNGKADALNRQQRFNDALIASDHVISLNPDYLKGWINRGYILYNLGRYNDEQTAYERAVQIDPNSAEAWFNKGYSLGGMGKWEDALKAFDRVQALNPSYPNLAANQQIAKMNLDATTPFYIKNALPIAVLAIIIIGITIWYWQKRKKE